MNNRDIVAKKFGENLKKYLKKRNLTQRDLCREFGFAPPTVSNWTKGNRLPPMNTVAAIASFLNASTTELLEGIAMEPNEKQKYVVPVLGRVQAGIPIQAVQDIIDYEEITEKMASQGEHFGLLIKGDSMTPRFCENDVVIVRKQSDLDSGDIGIVLVDGNDATIKKVVKFDGGISLVPANPIYDVITYTDDQIEQLPIQILGKVVELRAKF